MWITTLIIAFSGVDGFHKAQDVLKTCWNRALERQHEGTDFAMFTQNKR